jgi:WD40 repeat protein
MVAVQVEDPPFEAELALSEAAYPPGTVRNFAGHEGEVITLALSPDGGTLVSYSNDHTIRQWDVQSGQQIQQVDLPELGIPEFRPALKAAAFSPDGRQLLLGLDDLSLVLLDVETGEAIQRMVGHTSPIMMVAFSPDGQTSLSGSGPLNYNDDPPPGSDLSARLWDLSTGEEIRRYDGHTHNVFNLAFGPDGRAAATGSWDDSLILWDLQTGEILHKEVSDHEFGSGDVNFLAISPDGHQILAQSGEHLINLWDMETWQLIHSWSGLGWPTNLEISPDGRLGASGHLSGGAINVFDLETGDILLRLKGGGYLIAKLLFTDASDQLFSSSADSLRLWSLKNGAEVQRFEHGVDVRDAAYSPDGRTAISSEITGALNLWHLESGRQLLRIDFLENSWEVIYTLDGASALVTFTNGEVIQYDLSTGDEIQRLGGENEDDGHRSSDFVDAIALSPDGRTVLTGSQDGFGRNLFLWDLESGEQLMEFDTVNVTSVDFSPDGKTALSAGSELILWDLESGEALRKFEGHDDDTWDVAFSPDGKTALSASWDDTLILWDLESGEIIHRLLGHLDDVRAVAFHPDGRTAISGSRDSTVILWDLETGKAIRTYRGHTSLVNGVEFSQDGKTVLSSGNDGLLIEWRIDDTLEELVSWVEGNRYFPELTCSEREQFNIEPLCE